jgi:hypothetical protein
MKFLSLKWGKEYVVAMGDTIDCVSLIMQLSEREPLLIPVQAHCMATVPSLFPKHAAVDFITMRNFAHLPELEREYETLSIHSDETKTVGIKGHIDMIGLYMAANLDYSKRDEHCPIPEQVKHAVQLKVPSRPYAFVPEGGSPGTYFINRKYVDPSLDIIVPPKNTPMLQWASIIEHATEIHCHITSWWRLIDKIPTRGKLFIHHYTRQSSIPTNEFEFRKYWEQII